jgi:hypothetical protein
MIWYLIFCSQVYGGSVCSEPVAMPNKEACIFVGKEMVSVRDSSYKSGGIARYRCVGVKK